MGKFSSSKDFYIHIARMTRPEELFGDLGSTPGQQLAQLDQTYKALIKQYHPDHYASRPAELTYVTEIATRINEYREQALVRIKAGVYGKPDSADAGTIIRTERHDYIVTGMLVEGAQADIYHAYYLDPRDRDQPRKEVVIKIIAKPADNPLVMREAACYQALPQHFCFPTLIDEFRTGQGQAALVLSCITGSIDLLELTRQYRGEHHTPGLPQEHLVWILDRFLAALGLLHAQNILHGNIQPDNLLVQPKNHNGVLIDFLHCRIQPAPDEVFDLTNLAYCAPELLSRRFKPHPVSDIYALGCCMLELIGGSADGLDDSIDLHPLLRAFLAKMVNPDPTQRAADAWALAAELKNLRQWLYGAHPQFIPLELGGSYGRR